MRRANAWCWIILAAGCSSRVQIGYDLPEAGSAGSGQAGSGGVGAGGGTGGTGAAGTGITGGVGGAFGSGGASAGGTGGSGGASGADGTGGIAGATGVGGSTGVGGASVGGASGAGGASIGGAGGSSGEGGVGAAAGAAGNGGNGGAAGAGGSISPPDGGAPAWPDPTPCPASAPSPLTGTWTGHLENYALPSGSDLVRLVIAGADTSSLCGTITFGPAPAPPPASDPNVGYPPGVTLERNTSDWYTPYEGFSYRLSAAAVNGASLHFQMHEFELWREWCSLQTAYRSDDTASYRCIPNGATEVSSGAGVDGGTSCAIVASSSERTAVDCDKLNLCGGLSDFTSVCACNAWGCNASPDTIHELDAQFDATTIRGYLRLSSPAQNLAGHDLAYGVAFVKD